ncbi:MAG: CdaR family protein [Acidobacteria bacterium]|nr:CdaR family protein [Acidobacteriota bacterium]
MIRFFTRNIGWKLLSLAIAVLIWIAVASEPELSTFVSVPVEFQNVPDDLEISSHAVESVTLELHGPAGELREVRNARAAVVLNLGDVAPGEHTFSINSDNTRLPRGVEMVRAIPSQLRLEFERRITRSVPVDVRFYNKPQSEYEVAGYTVHPPTLTIFGPESRVDAVKTAVTDRIDVSSVVGTSEFHVNAYVDDPYVRFQTPPYVTVQINMKKKGEAAPKPGS